MSLMETVPSLQNSAVVDKDIKTSKPAVTGQGDSNKVLPEYAVDDDSNHQQDTNVPESDAHQQNGTHGSEPSDLKDVGSLEQGGPALGEKDGTANGIQEEFNQHPVDTLIVASNIHQPQYSAEIYSASAAADHDKVPPSDEEHLINSDHRQTIPIIIGHSNDTAADEPEHPNSSSHAVSLDTEDHRTGPEHGSSSEQCQGISTDLKNSYNPNDPELRPPTTTWQQITIGMIGLGMEVCYATETALLVPILLQLGLPDSLYSVTWFISPVLGFLLQPFIGSCSDRCTSPWGRRRPFILALGLGIVVGLSFFLNGEYIGLKLGDTLTNHSIGIIITMIGQIILDWSADSGDTPSRSYMMDVFNPEDLEKSLTYRAFLGGMGGGIGYIINGIDWEKNALGKALGGQLYVVFLFCSVLSVLSIILTMCSVKETPLSKRQANHRVARDNQTKYTSIQNHDTKQYGTFLEGQKSNVERLLQVDESSRRSSVISSYNEDTDLEWDNSFDFHHFDLTNLTQHNYYGHIQFDTKNSDFVASETRRTKAVLRTRRKSTASLQLEERDHPGSAIQLLVSIFKMPKELRRLCFSHYLSWLAMVTIILFFTDFVGQAVFHGNPKAPMGSPERTLYQQGVHMGCWGMCICAFSAAISAVLYGRLVQFLSYRTLYVWTQALFAVGTGCQAIFSEYEWVTLALCVTFGFMFTTIQSTPFSILSDFHKTEQYVKSSGDHRRGLGTDVSCLTAIVFLAQITVSSILGPLMNAIGSHLVIVSFASLAAFSSSICAAIFVIYEIKEEKEEEDDVGVNGYVGVGETESSKYSESDEDEERPLLNS